MYSESEWLRVRRLFKQGLGYKAIGRELRIDWRTVKKLIFLPEPPRPSPRERDSILDDFKPTIEGWLTMIPKMRATVIRQKLDALGYEGSYSTVKRFVRKKKNEMFREATVRFETLPGEQAQVDFTKVKARYVDGSEDKVVVYFFLMGFSRLKDGDISGNEKRKTLMYLMEQTFWKLGGVVKEVLFDNLKPVAAKARTLRSEGQLAEEWKRFESTYGFETRLSMAYRAQTKGKVEKPFDPVKRFIESEVFLSREHLRRELKMYIREQNKKVHATTRERPVERFEKEASFLQPLPDRPLKLARVDRRKVSKDCFISLEGVKYSVPWEYVNQEMEVRTTETEVQIFTRRGSLVAAHRKLPVSLKDKYPYVVQEHHYKGLSGADEAFYNLEKLNALGFGPFYVAKRPLEDYLEVVR